MEDDFISRVLNNLLNPNHIIRTQAEEQFNSFKATQPSQLIYQLTIQLKSHLNEHIQTLSAVLLIRIIPELWQNIEKPTQLNLKNLLLQSLAETNVFNVAKKISDVVSELAILIFRVSDCERWPELLQFIKNSLCSDISLKVFTGFRVFLAIFPFFSDDFSGFREGLYQCYLKYFNSPDAELALVCIKSFTVMISVISTSETKYFVGLLQSLLKSVINLSGVSSYFAQEAIKALRDLAETEPWFFKPRLAWCFVFVEHMLKTFSDFSIQYLCLEFMAVVIEKFEDVINEKLKNYDQIFEAFRVAFVNTTLKKEDKESKVEINYGRNILEVLGNVADCLNKHIVEIIVRNGEEKLMQSGDWQTKLTLVLFLMQVAPHFFNTEKFEKMIGVIVDNCRDEDFRVRKVCFTALKQFCLEFPKVFQNKFHEKIVEALFLGFADCNQRVACESFKALKEFMEGSDEYVKILYTKRFLPALAGQLDVFTNLEVVLSVIQSISLFVLKKIHGYFEEFFPRILRILKKSPKLKIKISAIDCLLALRVTLKRSEFSNYAPAYISLLKTFADPNFSSEFSRSCILDSWKILAVHLRSNFTQFLPEIVPQLLNSIRVSAPYDIEEHLETLLSIIDSSKGSYFQYFQLTSDIIIPLITINSEEPIRVLASNIAASLVQVIRDSGNEEYTKNIINFARNFLTLIWQVCNAENDLNTLIGIMSSVTTIIKVPGIEFLTLEEVTQIGEIVLKLLQNHAICKSADKDFVYEQDYLKQTTSEMLSALFKSHTLLSIEILSYVYNNVIHTFLESNRSENDKIFSLSIISDILYSVGNVIDPAKLNGLIEIIINNITLGSHKIKSAALYGLISVAMGISPEKISGLLLQILSTLEKTIKALDSRNKIDKAIIELAIIAVGFILKYHRLTLKLDVLLPWWVQFLPIKKYKVFGRELHDFLADLIINEVTEFAGSIEIIRLLLSIAFTEFCLLVTIPKISKILTIYLQNNSKEILFAAVSPNLRIKLNRLIIS